jgi:hypothetical protein
MGMWNQIAFGGFLIVVAIGLYWHHHRAEANWSAEVARWPEAAATEHSRNSRDRQRRRVRASWLIGVVGVAMIGGVFLESTLYFAVFWAIVLVLVSYIVWLGLADLWLTRRHMRALNEQQRVATAQLRAELEAEIARLRTQASPESPPLDSA